MNLVFSYGTLRPSLYPHAVKRFGLVAMGKAALKGHFQMINLGAFPGLIEHAGLPKTSIVGEVISLASMENADRYEGCRYGRPGNLYDRKEVEVVMSADGKILKVWVYLFNYTDKDIHDPINVDGPQRPIVVGGDWENAIKGTR